MMKHIILFGGGLDSTATLLHLLSLYPAEDITLFHVSYGQKAVDKEYEAARYFSNKYRCNLYEGSIDLSFSSATIMNNTSVGTADTNRLELRNLALLSYAAAYAASTSEDSILYVGFHVEPVGSGFADAKTPYLQFLSQAIAKATDLTVEIKAPLRHLTRKEILQLAYSLDPEVLTRSYTCYEQQECGVCTHCIEKRQMVAELNLECP